MSLIKQKKTLICLLCFFLTVEAVMGVLIHTAQEYIPFSLRYTSVIVACLFFAIFAEKSFSYLFTQLALIFTLISDYFLIFCDENQKLVAMIFFSAAQIFYFLRLYFEEGSAFLRKLHLSVRACLCSLILPVTALVLDERCDALALVSMFYYANLVLNAVFAYVSFKHSPALAIGFTLFILCDTVIGISSLGAYFPIDKGSLLYKILHPGFDLAWAFYLPSQALISVSLFNTKSHTTGRRFSR